MTHSIVLRFSKGQSCQLRRGPLFLHYELLADEIRTGRLFNRRPCKEKALFMGWSQKLPSSQLYDERNESGRLCAFLSFER